MFLSGSWVSTWPRRSSKRRCVHTTWRTWSSSTLRDTWTCCVASKVSRPGREINPAPSPRPCRLHFASFFPHFASFSRLFCIWPPFSFFPFCGRYKKSTHPCESAVFLCYIMGAKIIICHEWHPYPFEKKKIDRGNTNKMCSQKFFF